MADISISDRDGFPKKIAAIRQAAQNLRGFDSSLNGIVLKATEEASSTTTTGAPAPIYSAALDGLNAWHKAVSAAIAAVCDSAENCAQSASDKFTKITGVDTDTAHAINAT